MDANAERVVARLFAVEEPLPKARAKLAALAAPLVPKERPGDFAQALMDLGSGICFAEETAVCARARSLSTARHADWGSLKRCRAKR